MRITNGVLWRETGLRMEVCESKLRNGDPNGSALTTLYINDLNPSVQITQCFTRFQLIRMGLWLIWKALRPNAWRKDGPQ